MKQKIAILAVKSFGSARTRNSAINRENSFTSDRSSCGVIGTTTCCFFFPAEDGIRDYKVTGVQTCALPISGGIYAPPRFVGTIDGKSRPPAQGTPVLSPEVAYVITDMMRSVVEQGTAV